MTRLSATLRRGLGLVWLLVLLAGAPCLPAADLPQPVQAWLSAQTNVLSWSAEFTQTRRLKSLTQPLVTQGRVWFRVPNRIRWELGTPAQTVAVRGAEDFVVAYPKLKRAERYSLSGSGPWKEALALLEGGFLRDPAEFDRQFKVMTVSTTNSVCTVQLQPKSGGARRMMPLFTLAFGAVDHVLVATELQLADGSTLRNEFSGSVLNPKLEDSIFSPPIDASYTIVEPMKR